MIARADIGLGIPEEPMKSPALPDVVSPGRIWAMAGFNIKPLAPTIKMETIPTSQSTTVPISY
jgi:dipeptidase